MNAKSSPAARPAATGSVAEQNGCQPASSAMKRPHLKRSNAELVTRARQTAARALLEEERQTRETKTARLRALRLAQAAADPERSETTAANKGNNDNRDRHVAAGEDDEVD